MAKLRRTTRRTDRNKCGKVVYQLRTSKGLTQAELAAKAQVSGWDLSQYAVKRIENGEREVTDLEVVRLAKLLKVPAALLLTGF